MITIEEKRKIWLEKFEENKALFEGRIAEDIEKYRKGTASIRLTDAEGKPLSGVRVKVKQKTHDFGFGSHLFLLDAFDTPEQCAEYRELFSKYFNLATLPFYWDGLEPIEGEPRFAKDAPVRYRRPAPDLCLEYCNDKGIRAKLHCLVYDKFTPEWLPKGDMAAMERAYDKHIREIAERYRGKLCEFEVINETLETRSWVNASVLIQRPDMTEWAFDLARRHLPDEVLVINEGSTAMKNITEHRYFSRYFMQIDRAIAKGAEIDKIGIQYHTFTGVRSRTPEEYEADVRTPSHLMDPVATLSALDTLSYFDLPLEITEMTIPTFGDTPEDEALQADLLRYIYTMLFSHPKLDSIVYWNTVEGFCYDAGPEGRWNENIVRGTLFRRDLTPKPAADMLYHLIHEVWHTEYEAETDEDGNLTVRGFYGNYELEYDGKRVELGLHK